MNCLLKILIAGVLSIGVLSINVGSIATGEDLSFNRDIRSILSDNCFACHGPDEHGRQADLRLDDRQAAIDSGAITPGDADASAIIERMLSTDPDVVMPPPKSGKTVKPEQIAVFRRWLDEGALYQEHWSFAPIAEQVVAPPVDDSRTWIRDNLDRFVLQKLQEKKLEPAVESGRAQWLRRVSFDLVGLPPSLEQLDRFLGDKESNAYEKIVDELLASEKYGERMANMWLDVARYADTFGYQSDVAMEVWPWRDWVIRAFNDDMPYDEFLTQQTAGDLLPGASREQRLATTFNRLHRQTNEGGSVAEEFRQANIADRTATNATAFLGLTFECARCHDHKYDPILTKDFYSMSAYFANIDELGLYSHFTFSAPTPALLLYEGEQEAKHLAALAEVARLESELKSAAESFAARAASQGGDQVKISAISETPKADFAFPFEGDASGVVGKAMRCDGDDEVPCEKMPELGRTDAFTLGIWVKPALSQPRMLVLHQSVAAEDSGFRGLQLTIDNGHPEFSMINFWPGNAVQVETVESIPVNAWSHIAITHDGSGRGDGLQIFINGQSVKTRIERDQLTRDIRHRTEWGDMSVGNVKFAVGARFRDIGFRDGLVDDLQCFQRCLSDAEVATIVNAAVSQTSDETVRLLPHIEITPQMDLKHEWLNDETCQLLTAKLRDARRSENEIVTAVREIMTMQTAAIPRQSFVLQRGDYTLPTDEVQAATPKFLPGVDGAPTDRRGLAQWLTAADNPLVARVIANRFWHLFFGRGIVASLEDFGSQGVPPSHPQLLDHLARSLIDDGWSLKNLCRRIVLSSTYRQSSVPRDASLFESDPSNQWLARGPKHRLSAEQVRDTALFASDLLVNTIGGPSVMPYQPTGLWEEAGTGKSYTQATGAGLYRRSLYTFWKRTSPPPAMLMFDATTRETCTAKRELTTTPLQALVLLNDPQYVEASRVLAQQLIANHGDDLAARWTELFRRLVSRSPSQEESEIVAKLYDEQLVYFQTNQASTEEFLKVGATKTSQEFSTSDLAATSIVVDALLSYDETQMKR